MSDLFDLWNIEYNLFFTNIFFTWSSIYGYGLRSSRHFASKIWNVIPANISNVNKLSDLLFLSGFSFTDAEYSQDSRGRKRTIFYSPLTLPPAHEHSDIYLQSCKWDDYHIFLTATLVFTRLLLDDIYHFIESIFDWRGMWCRFSFVCLLIWF